MTLTRFAPSPTGFMHVGNARACILPYLLGKKLDLRFLLRIDDTDSTRSKDVFIQSIYKDLEWLGIKWDYTFRQSERLAKYQDLMAKCIKAGIVYPVSDTEEELDELKLYLRSMKQPPAYKRVHAKSTGKQIYWRFDIGNQVICFKDQIKGSIEVNLASISDPVICKSNGEFTYTFASISDDLFENVSHVVRGADHITNTAVQLGIVNKLLKHDIVDVPNITFAHFPLFQDRSGIKFSKRNKSFCLQEMRNTIHPLALNHYLTYLGSGQKRVLCDDLEKLAESFDLSNYASSNLVEFNEGEILQWQKQVFLHFEYEKISDFLGKDLPDLRFAWDVVKECINNKEDAKTWSCILLDKVSFPTLYKFEIPQTQTRQSILEYLKSIEGNNHDKMMFLRQILTGENSGPKLAQLLDVMSDEIFAYRIQNYYHVDLKFYNTLTKSKDTFIPIKPGHVTMYACGPTAYASPHIGNARSFITFDVLYRLLRYFYKNVNYVRNITDIDDKIIDTAQAQEITCDELVNKVYIQFKTDMQKLNILEPTNEPRVTDHMDEIINSIQILLDSGFAYIVDDGVYFDINQLNKFKNYDIFHCLKDFEQAETGANFALWKFRDENDISWPSPWGFGRPGWHIECTAMAKTKLGLPFDIHCGGRDLIFPHHTNECAQGYALTGRETAKYWLHNNFINVDQMKMSKSLGNFVTLSEIRIHPMILRLALLMTHYRQELNWSEALLTEVTSLYNKWRRNLGKNYDHNKVGNLVKDFMIALCDDMNLPSAIRILDHHNIPEDVIKSFQMIGIEFEFGYLHDAAIRDLVEERQIARKSQDFARADEIREILTDMDVELEESRDSVHWYQVVR